MRGRSGSVAAVLVAIAVVALLAGCASSPAPAGAPPGQAAPSRPSGFNGSRRGGNFSNLTAEQIQQLAQQRQQAALDACGGLSEGDACQMSMGGRFNLTGTCTTGQAGLSCVSSRSFNGTRGAPPSG